VQTFAKTAQTNFVKITVYTLDDCSIGKTA